MPGRRSDTVFVKPGMPNGQDCVCGERPGDTGETGVRGSVRLGRDPGFHQ
jgi:hypothetical protein